MTFPSFQTVSVNRSSFHQSIVQQAGGLEVRLAAQTSEHEATPVNSARSLLDLSRLTSPASIYIHGFAEEFQDAPWVSLSFGGWQKDSSPHTLSESKVFLSLEDAEAAYKALGNAIREAGGTV